MVHPIHAFTVLGEAGGDVSAQTIDPKALATQTINGVRFFTKDSARLLLPAIKSKYGFTTAKARQMQFAEGGQKYPVLQLEASSEDATVQGQMSTLGTMQELQKTEGVVFAVEGDLSLSDPIVNLYGVKTADAKAVAAATASPQALLSLTFIPPDVVDEIHLRFATGAAPGGVSPWLWLGLGAAAVLAVAATKQDGKQSA